MNTKTNHTDTTSIMLNELLNTMEEIHFLAGGLNNNTLLHRDILGGLETAIVIDEREQTQLSARQLAYEASRVFNSITYLLIKSQEDSQKIIDIIQGIEEG